MIVVNFSHPLTERQQQAIAALMQQPIERVIDVPVQLDQHSGFAEQIGAIVDSIELARESWQTRRLLVVPPGHAPAAAVLLAELHGRTGHFPIIVRLRPDPNGIEPYAVAELVRLQTVRDSARERRYV